MSWYRYYLYCRLILSSPSVRTHIRDGHPDFIVTADSWPAFLYPNAKGDVDNIELGLFRSAILLKVCILVGKSHETPEDSSVLQNIFVVEEECVCIITWSLEERFARHPSN